MFSVRVAFVVTVSALVMACGGSDGPSTTAPSPTPPSPSNDPSSVVAIPAGAQSLGTRAFMPDEINVATGSTVTWTNTDRESHTSTSDESGWNSGIIAPGGRFSFTFD